MNDCDQLAQAASKLDYLWVARWLDDIGLPQFKENFLNTRIDGSRLHKLTIQDLIQLNITNKLHYCSIRRGIQVLREQKFEANCLERRSVSNDKMDGINYNPSSIALWTSHRVMEWLRCIDLSEYTSSLRGSGVHGALIIHEPAFDADLLASLLGIPSSKSLLRRYIYTSLNNLIGPELVQVKKDYRSKNLSPIISTKISIKTSRFNLLKRRSKPEFQSNELVCPMVNSVDNTSCPVHRKPNTPVKVNNVSNGDHNN
ncbi:liprin-beta-2-like isoform X2 [Panonychus citri]|uniref:liprin-beta-2-like isoform X2 n=1 Tax=Panonychus citri TaxID=50023 RepID=UPI00230743DC|nr:liprin-beta-2-like isoform X2 [Panonychus citri]